MPAVSTGVVPCPAASPLKTGPATHGGQQAAQSARREQGP